MLCALRAARRKLERLLEVSLLSGSSQDSSNSIHG
jgi:hypothetical protein